VTGAIGVIGGGTMGAGIAYVFAAAGYEVSVVEPSETQAQTLTRVLAEQARLGCQRGKLTEAKADALPERVRRLSAVEQLPPGLELVVESVPERFELKREVLACAERRSPELLATNTSSLAIGALGVALARPQDLLGMHFFNPVWSLALVELVRSERTSERTVARARELVSEIGKEAIVVRDVPGFATSRLDLISALEAMRMLQDGVATAEEIDRAVVLAYRHPVGPLRLSDIVGLDVRLDIAESLAAAHGDRFAPPAILREKVAAGELGAKSGRGFYSWR
jgi:3-hydroxybutyryl-CoA dehydrogenase